ncbi:MAG: hypothetical protein BJ554DRAFT_7687, partial [Olpidium bornovanus]
QRDDPPAAVGKRTGALSAPAARGELRKSRLHAEAAAERVHVRGPVAARGQRAPALRRLDGDARPRRPEKRFGGRRGAGRHPPGRPRRRRGSARRGRGHRRGGGGGGGPDLFSTASFDAGPHGNNLAAADAHDVHVWRRLFDVLAKRKRPALRREARPRAADRDAGEEGQRHLDRRRQSHRVQDPGAQLEKTQVSLGDRTKRRGGDKMRGGRGQIRRHIHGLPHAYQYVTFSRLDGESAARMIKSTANVNRNTPIVAVTAYEHAQMSPAFDDVIHKPITMQAIIRVLQHLG